MCEQHAYECASQPLVTIEKLTKDELGVIALSEKAVAQAEEALKVAKNGIVLAHGGFVIPDCLSGCLMFSGQRTSDGVEWKGDYIILTKKWIPEL